MSETSLETSPGASFAVLMTLEWSNEPVSGGDPAKTVLRYTNWTQDVEVGGETFVSAPNMEVELGEIHGGTEDRPGKLTISRQFKPFDTLRKGLTHPKISVKIEQADPLDPVNTRRQLFWGQIGRIRSNPGGRASLVTAQLNGIKAQLKQIKLSVPATPTCVWSFGDENCGYDKEATKMTGSVLSIGSPQRVSIQLDFGSGTTPNNRYRQGIVKVGGMSFIIRKSNNDGTFDLFRIPPPWVVGLDVELFEGCDKNLSTCEQYNRVISFMGIGIRIPGRQPVFEE